MARASVGLAVALIGEVFRRGGSEWGGVAETSLIFAAILAVAVILTSGSARSRIRSLVVENFFSNRYDYRREWMRCIDALTAPEAFVALHKRAIRAAAEIVDSPAGALFVRPPRDVAFQWAGSWNMPAAAAPVVSAARAVLALMRVVSVTARLAGMRALVELVARVAQRAPLDPMPRRSSAALVVLAVVLERLVRVRWV